MKDSIENKIQLSNRIFSKVVKISDTVAPSATKLDNLWKHNYCAIIGASAQNIV